MKKILMVALLSSSSLFARNILNEAAFLVWGSEILEEFLQHAPEPADIMKLTKQELAFRKAQQLGILLKDCYEHQGDSGLCLELKTKHQQALQDYLASDEESNNQASSSVELESK